MLNTIVLESFIEVLYTIIRSYRAHTRNNPAEDEWLEMLFSKLNGQEFTNALIQQMPNYDDYETMHLLELELSAVTLRMNQILRQPSFFARLLSFRRKVELKEGIKAGGVVFDSLKDLLGDGAPYWLKSLLTIAKEAIDVLTGDA